jgi:hypothetical protein
MSDLENIGKSGQVTAEKDDRERYLSEIGRQGNEIGELRRQLREQSEVIDKYILKQDEATISENLDPDQVQAMERLVQQKVKPLQDKLSQYDINAAEQRLAAVHPDYKQVITDPSFQAWVDGSRVRATALQAGISAGDVDTVADLLQTYKREQGTPSNSAMDTALSMNRGGSGDMAPRESTLYRRADIIRKKNEDPEWYRDHLSEIRKAYAEGRVR